MRHQFFTLRMRANLVAASGVLAALALAQPADAAGRRGEETITACSHYGHGCVSAPTRSGQFGREVRLPGGTWIGCDGDCKLKLVEETIDFWDRHETQGAERQ